MPRTLTVGFRQAIEQPATGILALFLLDIDHSKLEVPIRVVSDVVSYIYGGNKYLGGFRFEGTITSDDEQPPKARLRVQNVDQRIANVVTALPTPPQIIAYVLSSDDFTEAIDPDQKAKLEIGTATRMFYAPFLRLRNVRGDAMALEGDLSVYDPTTEPYPSIRATPDRLPALFR